MESCSLHPTGTGQNAPAELIAGANEIAAKIRASMVTFLATLSYLFITTASSTHEMLLRREAVKLPLVDADIPIFYFGIVAGGVLVCLHGSLLALLVALSRITRKLEPEWKSEYRNSLVPGMTIGRLILELERRRGIQGSPDRMATLGRICFGAVYVVLPQLCLLGLLAKFLPLRDDALILVHWILIAGDLLLVLWLVPVAFSVDGSPCTWWREYRKDFFGDWRVIGRLTLPAWGIFLSLVLTGLRIPPDCEPRAIDRILASLGLGRSIEARGGVLVPGIEGDIDRIASLPLGEDDKKSLLTRLPGLNLEKRDFRCGDFSGAILVNASFVGSNLQGARFDDAVLMGVNLSPNTNFKNIARDRFQEQLDESGKIQGREVQAGWSPVNLEHVSFTRAYLTGANFSWAKLRRVSLKGAHIDRTLLYETEIEDSDLSGLTGDDPVFREASFRDVDLRQADLKRANFEGASLLGANFALATLEGSDFLHAKLFGASFRNADLSGAKNMALSGVDLTGATVKLSCPIQLDLPDFADLRGVNHAPPEELSSDERDCLPLDLPEVEPKSHLAFNEFAPEAEGWSRWADRVLPGEVYREIIRRVRNGDQDFAAEEAALWLLRHSLEKYVPENPDLTDAITPDDLEWARAQGVTPEEVCLHDIDPPACAKSIRVLIKPSPPPPNQTPPPHTSGRTDPGTSSPKPSA